MGTTVSFSGKLKTELCKSKPTGCCRIALCYGLLLFSRSFSKADISIRTSSLDVATLYTSLLKLCFNAHAVISSGEGENAEYIVRVPGEADRNRIVNFYDSGEADWIFNPKYVKRTCCRWAFIRGAFLACGSMNSPDSNYHLEFAVRDSTLGFAFAAFLELCGYKAKSSFRKSVVALYFNNSNDIEEILSGMGASQFSLELMELKIVRDMRNKINRQNNFETANITKTVNAAVEQNEAIAFLEGNNLLGLLPPELYDIAILRRDNPDASLSALCKLYNGTITRSGINHRLQRIIAFADDKKQEK